MSIVLELEASGRKVGRVCSRDYRKGDGCPLILRQTSEDVLTANVFGILRNLRPSLWLNPILAQAFPQQQFPTCRLGEVDLCFWRSLEPPFNRKGKEGPTEPDVFLSFRDTVILIEAKYNAPLAARTSLDESRDQLIRLIDVAFSHAVGGQLFRVSPFVLVIGAWPKEPPLVSRYRSEEAVAAALMSAYSVAEATRIARVMAGRVSYVSWRGIAKVLLCEMQHASPREIPFMANVAQYIRLKLRRLAAGARQQP